MSEIYCALVDPDAVAIVPVAGDRVALDRNVLLRIGAIALLPLVLVQNLVLDFLLTAAIVLVASFTSSKVEVNANAPIVMSQSTQLPKTSQLNELSTLELAQALMERLSISPNDWHRLKSNRNSRANEQVAAAIVYLLKNQPQEAQARLEQAIGWLDRSISAPPCPTHGKS